MSAAAAFLIAIAPMRQDGRRGALFRMWSRSARSGIGRGFRG